MNYYQRELTEKSWQELISLRKKLDFILIGGWAVYLYTQALKSKDIDLIVSFDQLEFLRQNYRLSKNERLRKYEARKGAIQIDVYLPYYSFLGLPVESLLSQVVIIENFKTLKLEYLFLTKLYAFSQRKNTPKGRKDLADLISLSLSRGFKPERVVSLGKRYQLKQAFEEFEQALKELVEFPELNLNRHQFGRIKRGLGEWLGIFCPREEN